MKRICLLFLVLHFFTKTDAQWTDVGYRFQQSIVNAYPAAASCFNGFGQMDTTAAFVTTLERMEIHGNIDIPFMLWGIQYFDNLHYLDCSDNAIED